MNTPKVYFKDIGLIDYKKAWDYQTEIFNEIVRQKISNRKLTDNTLAVKTKNHLIFCEHPNVYTLGKSGDENHLLIDKNQLEQNHIDYYKINRGGDITYHGPGQIVGYPIFDLEHFFTDIHKYLRFLEEAIILTLEEYGITADRVEGLTGVWIDGEKPHLARKICAMGVKSSRWVTMHGFALNVNTDLSLFNNIIPCGIENKAVTSIKKELNKKIDINEVKAKLLINLANIFNFDVIQE